MWWFDWYDWMEQKNTVHVVVTAVIIQYLDTHKKKEQNNHVLFVSQFFIKKKKWEENKMPLCALLVLLSILVYTVIALVII